MARDILICSKKLLRSVEYLQTAEAQLQELAAARDRDGELYQAYQLKHAISILRHVRAQLCSWRPLEEYAGKRPGEENRN